MKQFLQTTELLENSNFYYIVTTNMGGTYSYVNSHYAKSFSYISDKIVGMLYQVPIHPDNARCVRKCPALCSAFDIVVVPPSVLGVTPSYL